MKKAEKDPLHTASLPLVQETRSTRIGPITIAATADSITHLHFGTADFLKGKPVEACPSAVLLVNRAFEELQEYLNGTRITFDLPLAPYGTPFQQRVWNVLRSIPYGETMYYAQVAALAGNPKASRAVGMANHNNPIAIFIPCHRVIGKNGSLTGFGGGLDIKRALLDLEQTNSADQHKN